MLARSDIHLCKVPLSYTNQLSFNNIEEQKEYFEKNTICSFENCSYQPRGALIRIPKYVDEIQECNYGYYKNYYKGVEKTYYFYIAQKDYQNEGVTNLTVVLDVFQTWYFEMFYGMCFVEREHIDNDEIGKNTYPEDFELGDYICEAKTWTPSLCGEVAYCLAVSDYSSDDFVGSVGGIFGKQYSGFMIFIYYRDTINDLTNKIKEYCDAGKGDAIAFIFTYPKNMLNANFDSGDCVAGWENTNQAFFNCNDFLNLNSISFKNVNYTPYNKKLFTYPYNFIKVENPNGGNVIYKIENFDDYNNIEFQIDGVFTQNPVFSLTPKNYCNVNYNFADSISLQSFGLCSWNNDNYANWFAQHQNTLNSESKNARMSFQANGAVAQRNYNNALDNNNTSMYKGVVNTVGGVVGNALSGNLGGALIGGVTGGINTYLDYQQGKRNAKNDLGNTDLLNTTNYQNSIRSLMASVKDAEVQPNSCRGDTSSAGLDLSRDTACFYIKQMSIKPEYAKKIDMYFQKYGYQINQIKYPNMFSRKKWNYIKTVDSNIYGEIPFEDKQQLEAMFDNGFTLWHKEKYMFNYDQENPIVD